MRSSGRPGGHKCSTARGEAGETVMLCSASAIGRSSRVSSGPITVTRLVTESSRTSGASAGTFPAAGGGAP